MSRTKWIKCHSEESQTASTWTKNRSAKKLEICINKTKQNKKNTRSHTQREIHEIFKYTAKYIHWLFVKLRNSVRWMWIEWMNGKVGMISLVFWFHVWLNRIFNLHRNHKLLSEIDGLITIIQLLAYPKHTYTHSVTHWALTNEHVQW